MWYVYIIELKTKEFYKGLTDNLERRLKQHLDGKVDVTRHKLPFRLIHVEVCTNRIEARVLEKFFKSGYGREIIKQIENELE